LTSATTSAANDRGRPDRARSSSPGSPASKNRLRHILTMPTCTSRRSAILVFGSPSAANNTIFARTTVANDAV
jgi:hypothetical protein